MHIIPVTLRSTSGSVVLRTLVLRRATNGPPQHFLRAQHDDFQAVLPSNSMFDREYASPDFVYFTNWFELVCFIPTGPRDLFEGWAGVCFRRRSRT